MSVLVRSFLLALLLVAGCIVEPEPELRVGIMEPNGYGPVFFAEVWPKDDIFWRMYNDSSSYAGFARNVVVMEVPDESLDTWWVAECSWAADSVLWKGR